jgi:hypothetical protein
VPTPIPPVVVPAIYKQQGITSFSPSSGPVGTVVTITGTGLTGTNLAWVGASRNGAVTVVSDTVVRVTIPAGSTTGAIGLFNPSCAAFSASAFTVTNVAAVLTQPGIQSFSPTSGPAGTVVTINGSGFTGASSAWVGAAHNAAVQVVSDTQIKVTVPVGATTGAIGVFNASFAAFTPGAFTVAAAATATYVQPSIQNFAPSAGPVGTVVTLNGSGFAGANLAWIGNAHNGVVQVVSDSQIRITIPAGATSGAIGVFNPGFVAFSATGFTVQ